MSEKQSDSKKSIISKIPFIGKLKSIKGIEWIIVAVACVVIFLIYFSTGTTTNNTNIITVSSSSQYVAELESKLSNVLSNVYGAGNVSVMVTIETGTEIVVATSKEEKTSTSTGANNSTTTTSVSEKPIIIGSEPLVLMEILPKIKGVIVVAGGANNVSVRLELLRAVQTLINVDADNIEIFVGK